MGQAKLKRLRFLARHNKCCFCGGTRHASTIDHVPARVCFPGRAFPEGFEFPACEHCQVASRIDELIFGFYVRMMDRNSANYDQEGTNRLITGLANNAPLLLPNPYLSPREKRTKLKGLGLKKPASMLAREIPLVEFDGEVNRHILRYLNKIACALFYKEIGSAVSDQSYIWTHWDQSTLPRAFESLEPFVKMTSKLTIGSRPNLQFGDRFSYRFDHNEETSAFAAIAKFGEGLIAAMLIVDENIWSKLDSQEDWTMVRDMFN